MQLTAKISQLLAIQTGTGKNGEWRNREVIVSPVLEQSSGISIFLWGDKCHDPNLVEGSICHIKFYIQSKEYNSKWNTQLTAIEILQPTEMQPIPFSIEIQIEEIFFDIGSLPNRFEKFKNITKNYFHILGRTLDSYKNLVYIGLKGSIDPSTLTKGNILKIPLQIESKFNYGWKTQLFADSFEIVKK